MQEDSTTMPNVIKIAKDRRLISRLCEISSGVELGASACAKLARGISFALLIIRLLCISPPTTAAKKCI